MAGVSDVYGLGIGGIETFSFKIRLTGGVGPGVGRGLLETRTRLSGISDV